MAGGSCCPQCSGRDIWRVRTWTVVVFWALALVLNHILYQSVETQFPPNSAEAVVLLPGINGMLIIVAATLTYFYCRSAGLRCKGCGHRWKDEPAPPKGGSWS